MYTIILQRLHEVKGVTKPNSKKIESATIGFWNVFDAKGNSVFRSFTIENGGESTSEANRDRRIMPDIYTIAWSKTSVSLPSKYQGRGLLLKSHKDSRYATDAFTTRRIFIHVGNYPHDTEGCILLNKNYDFQKDRGVGVVSTAAISEFYDLVTKDDPRNFVLKIFDIVKK